MLFAIGLSKKVLLADYLGKLVDYGYKSITALNTFEVVLVIMGYTLQIYFDFSGYCDMALGVSKMLNIDLPVNFKSPYRAINISDFWKRWHITLTRFLTKYIYIPLGGSRQGNIRTYINIMIVFVVSGLWHGAGFNFIIWGIIHGLASILYRMAKSLYDRIPKILQWFLTFVFVNISWVFFRAERLSYAGAMVAQIFRGGFGINAELRTILCSPPIIDTISRLFPFNIVIVVFFLIAFLITVTARNSTDMVQHFRTTGKSLAFSYFLLVLSIFSLSGVSNFLYTNF